MPRRPSKKIKLELVRFVFADQHGVLRGKTVVRRGCVDGKRRHHDDDVLAKDTSHNTAFPVFTPGGGSAMAEMQGAGDFLMVADPSTFGSSPGRRIPAGSMRHLFRDGKPVPFSTRQLLATP